MDNYEDEQSAETPNEVNRGVRGFFGENSLLLALINLYIKVCDMRLETLGMDSRLARHLKSKFVAGRVNLCPRWISRKLPTQAQGCPHLDGP